MAYDNPGPATPAADHLSKGEENHAIGTLNIPSHMLPEGMSEKVKEGDILEFRVTGPASEEGIPVEYNTGEGGDEGGKSDKWEDDFRKSMSPQAETNEPM